MISIVAALFAPLTPRPARNAHDPRPQDRGRIPHRVEQLGGGPPDEMPAARDRVGIHAGLRPRDRNRPRRHTWPRLGPPRHHQRRIEVAEVRPPGHESQEVHGVHTPGMPRYDVGSRSTPSTRRRRRGRDRRTGPDSSCSRAAATPCRRCTRGLHDDRLERPDHRLVARVAARRTTRLPRRSQAQCRAPAAMMPPGSRPPRPARARSSPRRRDRRA